MKAKDERFYLISYDIREPRRWRRLYRAMRGYGEWLQLSVFHCRLSRRRLVSLEATVRDIVNTAEDHVLIIDLGPATGGAAPAVVSIGIAYRPPERLPVIV
ncbi:MAG: CRISPR-associated endonuclease Cas2 [Thermodesulfobacteriota bacterium]